MLRRFLKWVSFRVFLLFDRLGLHVLPKHYYSPVPSYCWLEKNKEAWIGRATLTGIKWDLDEQFEWLAKMCRPYYDEVAGLALYNQVATSEVGLGFGPIESQVLHCFIRANAPPRIIEIGSGVSTSCMLHAANLNHNRGKPQSRITCIDPYPRKAFSNVSNVHHLEQPCQTVAPAVFSELRAGDLLFVDSSHSVKVGSDVIRIYLEILPGLPSGVFVHIHDVFLPYIYPRTALSELWGWQETALLLALLMNNPHLAVLACLSALHYDRTEKVAGVLWDYRPQANFEGLCTAYPPRGDFPCSLWLRTC